VQEQQAIDRTHRISQTKHVLPIVWYVKHHRRAHRTIAKKQWISDELIQAEALSKSFEEMWFCLVRLTDKG
jgi:SNF2 family DNA or RNA helicase